MVYIMSCKRLERFLSSPRGGRALANQAEHCSSAIAIMPQDAAWNVFPSAKARSAAVRDASNPNVLKRYQAS